MSRKKVLAPVLLLAGLMWGSCAGPKQVSTVASIDSLSVAAAWHNSEAETPEYRLGFGDVLDIRFFNSAQFDQTVTVRPDGRISILRLGDVYVNGMTPSQLDSIITEKYAEIIIDPDITVIVREFGAYQVYVLGEVNRSGGIALRREMTLLQAIAAAGGPNNYAKLSSVMLLRRDGKGEVEAVRIDLTKSLSGEAPSDLPVQAQDIIYLPKTFVASASVFMRQVYDGVLPPIDSYLRGVLAYRRLRDF
ncbi:MAG: polysaccharide biosynthesis/export family protein [Calditrichaeota bacterium]|nr:polysaccharide biosynthesis/export family protein [Calditrichota bacterium]MCB9087838.1 polysaccharide biosynthesis/export family protein [Calditrichia bacterium]MCB0289181.1 polysaccharide biosynthesis/export family protein [Calditrichota bacterium]MCB0294380.1 polysaccharide biosynthesis/export family protein [Calditrichota bacterium]MCB0302512.1 polysaccharide biosynthesis/export family protein [Calditrichota bacterium]